MPLALTQLRNTGQNLSDLVLSSICRLPARPAGHEELVIVTLAFLCFCPHSWDSVSEFTSRRKGIREKSLTFRLDLEGCAYQGEECGIEGDCAIAVEGHVHAHQPLCREKSDLQMRGDQAQLIRSSSASVGRLQGLQCGLTRMHS